MFLLVEYIYHLIIYFADCKYFAKTKQLYLNSLLRTPLFIANLKEKNFAKGLSFIILCLALQNMIYNIWGIIDGKCRQRLLVSKGLFTLFQVTQFYVRAIHYGTL